MEGLEVSVLRWSEVRFGNSVNRLDSEYFKKEFLREDNLIKNFKNDYLGNFAFITDGQHGYHEVDEKSEIRHLKAQNFKNWFAIDNNAERLAKWVDDKNKRSSLEVNDIVLTTRGTVGFCAIVKQEVLPANIDQDVVRIAINPDSKILPQYLLCYINSKFGQDWTKRNQTGMVQQGLSIWRIKEFPIPILSMDFQTKIQVLIENSKNKINLSQTTYAAAENLLLEAIGLKNFAPDTGSVNIKSFKNSFLSTGRLDAEYYQVKYEQIEKIITSGSFVNIKDIKCHNGRGLQPEYVIDGILDVINSKHILDKSLDYDNFEKTSLRNWETQERARVFKGDILTYTTGANIGRTQVYQSAKKAIASNHVNILRVEKENPLYVGFVMNSIVGKMQTEKFSMGSAQAELYSKDIDDFIIPIISHDKQTQIAALVSESFRLKTESEQLLKTAKAAVELAIEENETAAMEIINTRA